MSANDTRDPNDFTREAGAERVGLVAEFWDFLKHNKKWWLLPILVVVALIGALVYVGGSAAMPFVYPLF
ncbi:MAG TPA: DUF5989 family protein [Phycisphaerae bacterium]|nr:DUF5989 family protein [Phycisphaerae bacterium]